MSYLSSIFSSRDPQCISIPASGGGVSQNQKFSYGFASSPGKRSSMEDFFETQICEVDGQIVGLFGVFDGHGGARAAEYVKQKLFANLISHPKFISDTKLAIADAYKQTDKEFLNTENSQHRDAGSTASTAVLVGDRLLVANVGDSRAVICRAGKAVALSRDHKPNQTDSSDQNETNCCRLQKDSSKMQKAWFYKEYGSIDVLEFGEFPVPKPGPGEILVKVKAAALNPVDFKKREGLFKSDDCDFPAVPGCDAAGVVVEVGDGVSKFKNGDEVYTDVQVFTAGKPKQLGTLAQYTLVEEHLVAPKPTNLSFEEAASLPLAVLTAQEAFDRAKFEKGQSVFIVGGAGGVGSLAIQLAKHVYGASRIVSTASTGKLDFVKSLGADEVIDYTKQSYEQISEKFDFVFDTIGESSKSHVVAKEEAKVLDIASFQPIPRAEFFLVTPSAHNLEKLQPYIESEKLKPVIDPKSPFSFSDVIEAFKHQESGRAKGKIVISPID